MNPQADLIKKATELAHRAGANHSERYTAESAVNIVESNGRLEAAIKDLENSTNRNAKASEETNKTLVKLTWVLVIGLGIQIILQLCQKAGV